MSSIERIKWVYIRDFSLHNPQAGSAAPECFLSLKVAYASFLKFLFVIGLAIKLSIVELRDSIIYVSLGGYSWIVTRLYQRSISPRTISIDPMMAMTSAIMLRTNANDWAWPQEDHSQRQNRQRGTDVCTGGTRLVIWQTRARHFHRILDSQYAFEYCLRGRFIRKYAPPVPSHQASSVCIVPATYGHSFCLNRCVYP